MKLTDSRDDGGDILDRSRDEGVVAVLSLLQLDQLGVSGGVGLHGLEGGGLVGEGLLDGGGDGVGDGVGVPQPVGVAQQLRGGLGGGNNNGQHNLDKYFLNENIFDWDDDLTKNFIVERFCYN